MDEIIINEGHQEVSSIPFMSIRQFDATRLPHTEPQDSFWSNPRQNMEQPQVIRARVFRVNKETGTMNVIGLDADVNMEVPITFGFAGTDFYGEVSLPAPGWEVLLLRTDNGDYYPIRYKRPYSEENGWANNIPEEIESGDWGVTTSGGGKMFLFDSGLVQIEASPSCMRSMSPVEDDERIEDICRRYGLHSDAGKIIASEYDNAIGDASRIEIQTNESLSSETNPNAILTMGSFDLSKSSSGAMLRVFDPDTRESKGKLEINKFGHATLESSSTSLIKAPKVYLGSLDATEPVVLGNQLLKRIQDIENRILELQVAMTAHTHPVAGPNTGLAVVTTPINSPAMADDFLSDVAFSL